MIDVKTPPTTIARMQLCGGSRISEPLGTLLRFVRKASICLCIF